MRHKLPGYGLVSDFSCFYMGSYVHGTVFSYKLYKLSSEENVKAAREEVRALEKKNGEKNAEIMELVEHRDGWHKNCKEWMKKAHEYKNRLIEYGLYKRQSSSSEAEPPIKNAKLDANVNEE